MTILLPQTGASPYCELRPATDVRVLGIDAAAEISPADGGDGHVPRRIYFSREARGSK